MLVQQAEPVANTASNSKPQPTFGKKWSRNQRKRKGWNSSPGTRQESRFLKDIILQVPGVSQAAIAAIPGPSIDDRQSIDSLLADNDGQDMKQEETRTQHPEQNVAQVSEVDGALPPPAVDLLPVICRTRNRSWINLEP